MKIIRPRIYEPQAKRDLRSHLRRRIRGGDRDETPLVTMNIVFLALLAGKIKATREIRGRFTNVNRVDARHIDEMSRRYSGDFERVIRDYGMPLVGDETRGERMRSSFRRVEIIGQMAVWESFNDGKVNRFREYDPNGMVMWVATLDERTCDVCGELHGETFPMWGVLPRMPAHIGCRCVWMYVRAEDMT